MKIEYKIKGVTLDVYDLVEINEYFKTASTAEYLLDNYKCIADETQAMRLAAKVRRYMDKFCMSESDAIYDVMEDINNKQEG